jgi:hypothetical protein
VKVTDNTLRRLAFTMGIPYFFSSDCVFDRAAGTATISRRFFFFPIVKQISLAAIDKVVLELQPLTSEERAKGEIPQPYPVMIMRDGSRLRLASSTGAGAKWAAEAINTFLQAR